MCMALPHPHKTYNRDRRWQNTQHGFADDREATVSFQVWTGFCNCNHDGAGVKKVTLMETESEPGWVLQAAVGTLPGPQGLVCMGDSGHAEDVCLLLRDNTGVACIYHICVRPINQSSEKLDM